MLWALGNAIVCLDGNQGSGYYWEFVCDSGFCGIKAGAVISHVFCWPLGILEKREESVLALKQSKFGGAEALPQLYWRMAQGAAADTGSQIPPKGPNTISLAWNWIHKRK